MPLRNLKRKIPKIGETFLTQQREGEKTKEAKEVEDWLKLPTAMRIATLPYKLIKTSIRRLLGMDKGF